MKTVCSGDYTSQAHNPQCVKNATSSLNPDDFSRLLRLPCLPQAVQVEKWRCIESLEECGEDLREKNVVFLGEHAAHVDFLVRTVRNLRSITLRQDFDLAFKVQEHFVEGYSLRSTFFFKEAFGSQCDYLVASASQTNKSTICPEAFEILALATTRLQIGELLLLQPFAQTNVNP